MAEKLKFTRKPWELPKAKAQSGRLVKTKFYHTPLWRRTRHAYMAHRVEHTKDLLQEFLNTGKEIPEAVGALHPLCEEFEMEGKYVKADMVDHIQPINRVDPWDMQMGTYGHPTDWDNLQSLSNHKHAVKSGKEAHK